jgi:hypothetical protein
MPTFDQLLMDSMPLAAADTIARTAYAQARQAYEAKAQEAAPAGDPDDPSDPPPVPVKKPFVLSGDPAMAGLVKVLSPGQSFKVSVPIVTNYDDPEHKSIWAWSHDGSDPTKVTDIWCRSRSSHYMSHLVLTALRWGLEEESSKGTFWRMVRITTASGVAYKLPLLNDYMNFKAVVDEARIESDQTPLWRLEAETDPSLVMAFAYRLKLDGTTAPMTRKEIDDLGEDFMPAPAPEAGHRAPVNRKLAVAVDDPRAIVILSLTVCKQRADFEPIDIVGMGRIFPHILVMTNVPLAKIEGAVLYDRPERMTFDTDEVLPPPPKNIVDSVFGSQGCCRSYDDHNPEIGTIFVADANDYGGAAVHTPGPLPFWGNMFSYYMMDAYNAIQNETLRVVRTDKPFERSDDSGLAVRNVVTGDDDYKLLLKRPFQGEFDNIHIAPSMVLKNVKRASHVESELSEFDVPLSILDCAKIYMAPFCSHDCFHTHWRWSPNATKKQALGFNGRQPYTTPGAPQVPTNQDIRIWLRAPNKMTYHATVSGTAAAPVELGIWNVIMHHGSAYAVDITAYGKFFFAQLGVDHFADAKPLFYPDSSLPKLLQVQVSSEESFALFYWLLRWRTEVDDNGPKKVERITITDLAAARNL